MTRRAPVDLSEVAATLSRTGMALRPLAERVPWPRDRARELNVPVRRDLDTLAEAIATLSRCADHAGETLSRYVEERAARDLAAGPRLVEPADREAAALRTDLQPVLDQLALVAGSLR